MRKLAIALAATIAMTSVAQADWNRHRYHNGYHHYNGGDNSGALIGGLVGGLIIGGMLNQMTQPHYYTQPYSYQPECQQVITNRYWNGWQWVYQTQTVCE